MGMATARKAEPTANGAKHRGKRVREPKLEPDEVFRGDDGIWWIPVQRIIPFADQPRKEFDDGELNSLAAGIGAVGQKNPGQVRQLQAGRDPRFELVDGERRLRACIIAGKTHFRAIVVTLTRDEQYIDSVTLNFGRSDHSPGEVLAIIVRLKGMGKTNAEIATILGRSEGFVNQYNELVRLHDTIRVLLGPPTPLEKRLPVTIARTLAQLEHRAQLTAWRELSRGEISMRRTQSIVRQAIESGAARNPGIRARERKPSDLVRLLESRLGAILDQLSTLAEDPMLDVVLEDEWSKQRTRALEQLEDIVVDAEDLRDRLNGDEPEERTRGERKKKKKVPKGGKAGSQQKAAPPTAATEHENDRSRNRMLRALGTMAETLYDLRTTPELATMFLGQPFAVVGFARLSVATLIEEAQRLNEGLPDAEDRHRYDPLAKLSSDGDDEDQPAAPSEPSETEEEELKFEVDASKAPSPEPKKKKGPR